jgi:ferrochelatase
LIVLPIAFVSEHSETLVELDIEYAHLAVEAKVPFYQRVATVSAHPSFIAGLALAVRQVLAAPAAIGSAEMARICPANCVACVYGGRQE